jgi:1-aminocyclopropane-1-carboxylate deaminase
MFLYDQSPTPVQHLDLLWCRKADIELYLKRDDLIHPFISGNKWRKLKFHVETFKKGNFSKLVTFGGAFSNHLLATACAGAMQGIATIGIVRGDAVDPENPVLSLCRIFGMQLMPVSKEIYAEKDLSQILKEEENLYRVEEGGRGADGVKGCLSIIEELTETYDHIFVAVGTGTTLAGLVKATKEKGLRTKIHGIAVLKDADYLKEYIRQQSGSADFVLHTDAHRGGYAKTDAELVDFIKAFASNTGILLDPIYTGKMMLAIKSLAEEGYFSKGAKVLAIHTGGLTGLLSKQMLTKF